MSGKGTLGFLCTSTALGGAELNAVRLAGWLAARGRRCIAIGAEAGPYLERCVEAGIETADIKPFARWGIPFSAHRLSRIVRDRGVDLIVSFSSQDTHIAAAASLFGRKRVPFAHYQQMQIGSPRRDLFHRLEHSLLSAWIAPLPWLAQQARELTRIAPGKIAVIPYGLELDRFRRRSGSRKHARTILSLPDDAFVIGTVGRLDRGKGQEYLLRAAARLPVQGKLLILIVGEDTRGEHQRYGEFLRGLTRELGLEQAVRFLPFRLDIETVFHAMDIFVLTSLSETFGMVTVEALASGLPVVGTNTAGTPEIIHDGETGLLVAPGDPERLARALYTLMETPELRHRLAEQGRRHAEERFSHHRQCEEIEKLVDRIIGEKNLGQASSFSR
ncbi:MAG: glycosyltransferase family 4 protein [Bacteroidota bacterium]|nr:glycosyltransferase family 4 protein [Bacteroidota bacterium]